MSYNWAGCLLLVSDERSPLIHSWSATFDGTCFNLRDASLKLILKLGFTDEATESLKNSWLLCSFFTFGSEIVLVKLSFKNSTGGVLSCSRGLNGDLCGQVTPGRSNESNIL